MPVGSTHALVSEKALDEFIAIWKRQFGEDLPRDRTLEYAIQLLDMVRAVYKPIPRTGD